MKSLQFLIGFICLTLLIGNSSATDEIGLQKLIFIQNADKADPKTDKLTIYFECDPSVMTTEYANHDVAFINDNTRTDILTLEFLGAPTLVEDKIQSLTFNIEDTEYSKITTIDITIKLVSHKTGSPSLEGTAAVNIDTSTPYVDSMESTIYVIDWKNKKGDLRIPKEVPENYIISNSGGDLGDDVTCLTSADTACYFLQTKVLVGSTFFVCKNIATAGKLLLCSEPMDYVKDGIASGFTDQPVTVDANGNILITASHASDSSNWEMVLSNGNPSDQKVCGDTFASTASPACTPQPTGDLDVLLVGVKADDGSVIEFGKTPDAVQELAVSAQALSTGSTVIEVSVANKGSKLFYMSRDSPDSGSDPSYQDVNVDCHEIPETSECRGYFVNLDAFTYTVTVNKKKANGDNIGSPQYLTNTVVIPAAFREDYQMIHVETTTSKERHSKFDVCFNYATNVTTQETRYEFLAINSKGMWKKILGEKKRDESHACFYALELLSSDFNEKSKFIVVLRDTVNGNVLASGEAVLNLQAPRAIKPEVDNGSNGSSSTLAIVGAAIAGIACLMALVAAAVMFVMKINRDNDGLQYPLHRTSFDDANIIHGLDNPIPTM